MVIQQSTIVGFYIASIGQILMIVLALFFLNRKYTFRFSSVIVGFGVYFIASQFLMPIIYKLFTSISSVDSFLSQNGIVNYLLLSLLSAALTAPAAYLVLKWVRKGQWNIYEAMASGISYWIYNSVTSAMNYINQAKISELANNGELSTLLSAEITQADIDSYVEVLKQASLSQCLAQLLFFAAVLLMSTLIFMLVYHGMKRQNLLFVFASMGIHFATLFITYLATALPLWIYCIIVVAAALALGAGIFLYFRWYREQQRILIQKRREFKEMKAAQYQAKLAAKEAQTATPEEKPVEAPADPKQETPVDVFEETPKENSEENELK